MRFVLGRYSMRGGRQEVGGKFVSGIDLSKPDGTLNWTKLKREIRGAIEEVAADKGSPGRVQRIDIQIQRGAV